MEDQKVMNEFTKEFPRNLEFYKGYEDELKLIYLEHPEIQIFDMKKNFDTSSFQKFTLK